MCIVEGSIGVCCSRNHWSVYCRGTTGMCIVGGTIGLCIVGESLVYLL